MSKLELLGHFITNASFTIIFGYFAMHWDSDPEDCFATAANDQIVVLKTKAPSGKDSSAGGMDEDGEMDDSLVNVGERFRFCF